MSIICNEENKSAITVNSKIVGHCCLPFIQNLANQNNRSPYEELMYQLKSIKFLKGSRRKN